MNVVPGLKNMSRGKFSTVWMGVGGAGRNKTMVVLVDSTEISPPPPNAFAKIKNLDLNIWIREIRFLLNDVEI